MATSNETRVYHVHSNLNRETDTYYTPGGFKSLDQRSSLDFKNVRLRRSMSINVHQKHRFTRTHTHTHARMNARKHTHTHTHTRTHAHTQTHTSIDLKTIIQIQY